MGQESNDVDLCSKIDEFISEDNRKDICQSIGLIKEDVYHNNLHNGWSSGSINAGIVLSACRFENLPVTPHDVSSEFDITIRELLLSYRHICSKIDYLSVVPIKWTIFLEEYSQRLGLSKETVSKAFDVGQNGEVNGIVSGRKPRSYAASCIYATTKLDSGSIDSWVTQRKLSEMADASVSSIRSTYNDLLECYNS